MTLERETHVIDAPSRTPRGFVGVSRPLTIDGWQLEVALGEKPRHDLLDLCQELDLELLTPATVPPPARIDRWLSHLIARPEDWSRARYIERSGGGSAIFPDEALAIPLMIVRAIRKRPVDNIVMGIIAPHGRKVGFWLRVLGLRRSKPWAFGSSTGQIDAFIERLRMPLDQVFTNAFTSDTEFFAPCLARRLERQRPLILSAGKEHRDYLTLCRAVEGLDADVIINAFSPDAAPRNSRFPDTVPENVQFVDVTLRELRDLYQAATVTVVLTTPNRLGAGQTVAIEALSCGSSLVVTDGPEFERISRSGAAVCVRRGDVSQTRQAILDLLEDPSLVDARSSAAREFAEQIAGSRPDALAIIEQVLRGTWGRSQNQTNVAFDGT